MIIYAFRKDVLCVRFWPLHWRDLEENLGALARISTWLRPLFGLRNQLHGRFGPGLRLGLLLARKSSKVMVFKRFQRVFQVFKFFSISDDSLLNRSSKEALAGLPRLLPRLLAIPASTHRVTFDLSSRRSSCRRVCRRSTTPSAGDFRSIFRRFRPGPVAPEDLSSILAVFNPHFHISICRL